MWYFQGTFREGNCGRSEWVIPRCASVVCRLFWAKGNFSHRLKRNFCPSLNYLEKLELGALPIVSNYHPFWPSQIGQDKLSFTKKASAFPIILQWPLEALKAPYLIPSSRCLIYLCSLSISEPLVHVGSLSLSHVSGAPMYMYVLNLVIFFC